MKSGHIDLCLVKNTKNGEKEHQHAKALLPERKFSALRLLKKESHGSEAKVVSTDLPKL
jgi:hypothetical protein